ncbi:MAG: phosphate ABC transporter permease subunit PstC [Acidimicrobiia bacterium]|nr:phosphate ABC transporter permease subunit PstC [Acidimicrobiia bacterium]
MSAVSPQGLAERPAPSEIGSDLGGRGRGGRTDQAFRLLALLAGLSILAILALIAFSTIQKGWPAFSKLGTDYFFGTQWKPRSGQFGILPLVYGTFVVAAIAVVFAIPVSLGIAMFMTEVVPRRFRFGAITIVDLLAAVPSVVFGLWGIRILAPKLDHIFGNGFFRFLGDIPIVGNLFGDSSGRGFMTAGIVVALMITPIITSVTREVFATVPRNDKEGALALGATRWEMIRGVVLPHSSGGITGAVMLGLGRALGETIAVALLIGANPQISANLLGTGETIPAQIARQLSEANGLFRSALIGLGFVLFIITIAVNVTARRLVVVMDRRLKGA